MFSKMVKQVSMVKLALVLAMVLSLSSSWVAQAQNAWQAYFWEQDYPEFGPYVPVPQNGCKTVSVWFKNFGTQTWTPSNVKLIVKNDDNGFAGGVGTLINGMVSSSVSSGGIAEFRVNLCGNGKSVGNYTHKVDLGLWNYNVGAYIPDYDKGDGQDYSNVWWNIQVVAQTGPTPTKTPTPIPGGGLPDLDTSYTSIESPTPFYIGLSSLEVKFDVKNYGTGYAGTSRVGIWISRSSKGNPIDQNLKTFISIPSLAGGQRLEDLTATVNVPSNLVTGTYYVVFEADTDNNVVESDEDDRDSDSFVLQELATFTPIPTNTFTPIPTNTFTPIPTNTFTPIPTNTFTPIPTYTFTPIPTYTFTPMPTYTFTPVPPTNTPVVPTNTPGVPTATPTIDPSKPNLDIADVQANSGADVAVPIILTKNGANISNFAFEAVYDQSCLAEPYFETNLPLNYTFSDTYDPTNGKISLVMLSLGKDPMPDGIVATLNLKTICQPTAGQTKVALIKFLSSPPVAFGDTDGQEKIGTTLNGSVEIKSTLPTPTPVPTDTPIPATATNTPLPPTATPDSSKVQLRLSDQPARSGYIVSMPITATTNGQSVASAVFTVKYDPTCLAFDKAVSNLPAGFQISASPDVVKGEINLAFLMLSATQIQIPDGKIAQLDFKVICTPAGGQTQVTPLTLINSSFGSSTGQSISPEVINGSVTISAPVGLRGDCNDNDHLDPGDPRSVVLEVNDNDGALAKDVLVNVPFKGSEVGCDANADTFVNGIDILAVPKIIQGMYQVTSQVQKLVTARVRNNLTALAISPKLTLSGFQIMPDGTVVVQVVFAKNDYEVGSIIFGLDYDQSKLAEPNVYFDLPSTYTTTVFHKPEVIDGELFMAMVDTSNSTVGLADGTILTVSFKPIDGATVTASDIRFSTKPSPMFGSQAGEEIETSDTPQTSTATSCQMSLNGILAPLAGQPNRWHTVWNGQDDEIIVNLNNLKQPVSYRWELFYPPDNSIAPIYGQGTFDTDGIYTVTVPYPTRGQWGFPSVHGTYESHVTLWIDAPCDDQNWDHWYQASSTQPEMSLGHDEALCEHEGKWLLFSTKISLPQPGQKYFLQWDEYVVHPQDKSVCPIENPNCTDHKYSTQIITQSGIYTHSSWWPSTRPSDTIKEIHVGVNVLDKNGNNFGDGIGKDVYWYPWVCAAPKLSPTLKVEAPSRLPFGETGYITLTLNNVTSVNDIVSLQAQLTMGDNIVANGTVEKGNMFSFIDATSNSFVGTNSEAVGSGLVMRIPVKAVNEGCTTIKFFDHKLANSVPTWVDHTVNEAQICVVKMSQVAGMVYQQYRPTGKYDGVKVTLTNGQETFTAITDGHGAYTIANVPVGEYQATFEHALVVKAIRVVKVIDGATQVEEVGLWTGDLDQDGQVTARDQKILSTAIYPVNNLFFDLNGDGTTDILDLTMLTKNLHRQNMATTDAPKSTTRAGESLVERPNNLVSTESENILRLTTLQNGYLTLVTTKAMLAAGAKLDLAEGVTVAEVVAAPSVAGGYLHWHQDGDKLYISVLPVAGQTVAANEELVLICFSGNGQATIEAENVEVVKPHYIYMPIMLKK